MRIMLRVNCYADQVILVKFVLQDKLEINMAQLPTIDIPIV